MAEQTSSMLSQEPSSGDFWIWLDTFDAWLGGLQNLPIATSFARQDVSTELGLYMASGAPGGVFDAQASFSTSLGAEPSSPASKTCSSSTTSQDSLRHTTTITSYHPSNTTPGSPLLLMSSRQEPMVAPLPGVSALQELSSTITAETLLTTVGKEISPLLTSGATTGGTPSDSIQAWDPEAQQLIGPLIVDYGDGYRLDTLLIQDYNDMPDDNARAKFPDWILVGYPARYTGQVNVIRKIRGGSYQQPHKGLLANLAAREMERCIARKGTYEDDWRVSISPRPTLATLL
ncbi:hypothetical protein C8Q80DRAFT_1121116 [Daedaleopsis nitida]|nr:hypothetical protein C8Q80DRAFT_1121116 [Daedaleopsis nitida]